ncbi:YceI family protein [Halobacteriovorax sp. GB3]|uniref:YceI family protein n=1 Tax=Halobacteriovorax sp. GB3 TaxID=2719615 RepID=UPI0023601639|nr:YceI family protein [Halobacteriovorax sp. GB3]MDD0851805.1 YceI family protein [Halobacteriovorax sp. GB3]
MKNIFITLISLVSLSAFASNVDLKKSTFKWTGTKITGEKHFGKVPLKSADIKLKEDKLVGGSFEMDMTGITVEDIESKEWATKFVNHMKNEDFFVVNKYPTSKLVIKSVEGDKVKADMTLKGQTKPVEFTYKKDKKNFKGTLVFDRTKFGVKYGSGSFFKNLGDKVINDKVSVEFDVVLK